MSPAGIRLGVLGDPLAFTLSPTLHRAGLEAAGLTGNSSALRVSGEALGGRLRELAESGYLGVNVTTPHKEAVMAHLARVSERAVRSRSVNTVGFAPDGWWGETTDGPGLLDWLRASGWPPTSARVVMLGAGGAARSVALALALAGAHVTASARRPDAVAREWGDPVRPRFVEWRSPEERSALSEATLLVNATPLEDPIPVAEIPSGTRVVDLRYGSTLTPWVAAARERGLEAYDGLGLLVFQARASLSLWLGREVPLDPLARAVGWPR